MKVKVSISIEERTIEELEKYGSETWADIISNKEINLPCQKVLESIYHCDQIIAELVGSTDKIMNGIKKKVETEYNHQLSQTAKADRIQIRLAPANQSPSLITK